MEGIGSSSIVGEQNTSSLDKSAWGKQVDGQTPIPVMESEYWPSLADARLDKSASAKARKEKRHQPSEVQGSTVPPPSALLHGSDAITMPPVSHSIATNTHKVQESALPPASAPNGSPPLVSRPIRTNTHKGRQSTVPPASARKFGFQPHRGHHPMQPRLPVPWVGASAHRDFWLPSQGYQMYHPHWPPLQPRGNMNMPHPYGYFGNFPNGNGNHLYGPGGSFHHAWHQLHQQDFNPLYGITMNQPIMPMPPVRQAPPFFNPAPQFRNRPNFHGPPPMFHVPRSHLEPARVPTDYILHPPSHGTQTQASNQLPLRISVLKQIEYYFSDENLLRDHFLRMLMDEHGWVPISAVADFNRVKKMTTNIPFILDALLSSDLVEVQGNKIRRRDTWSKWVLVSICSSEASQNPEGEIKDNHQSGEDTSQKGSQQLVECTSNCIDTLAMMLSRPSLEDSSEKVLSLDDDSVKNIPDLTGNGQSVRCF